MKNYGYRGGIVDGGGFGSGELLAEYSPVTNSRNYAGVRIVLYGSREGTCFSGTLPMAEVKQLYSYLGEVIYPSSEAEIVFEEEKPTLMDSIRTIIYEALAGVVDAKIDVQGNCVTVSWGDRDH